MAWTNPRTWLAEVLTAALLNTHLRDNLLETAVAKVTTANDIVRATGANALARIASGAVGGNVANWKHVPASADVSVNTQITPQNDADLKLAILANEIWICRGIIVATCADSSVDFRYDFAVPSGAGGKFSAHEAPGGTATVDNDDSIGDDIQIDIIGGATAIVPIFAYLANGATPGDWQFRWAQGTSSATNLTRLKGSFLEFLKIA